MTRIPLLVVAITAALIAGASWSSSAKADTFDCATGTNLREDDSGFAKLYMVSFIDCRGLTRIQQTHVDSLVEYTYPGDFRWYDTWNTAIDLTGPSLFLGRPNNDSYALGKFTGCCVYYRMHATYWYDRKTPAGVVVRHTRVDNSPTIGSGFSPA